MAICQDRQRTLIYPHVDRPGIDADGLFVSGANMVTALILGASVFLSEFSIADSLTRSSLRRRKSRRPAPKTAR